MLIKNISLLCSRCLYKESPFCICFVGTGNQNDEGVAGMEQHCSQSLWLRVWLRMISQVMKFKLRFWISCIKILLEVLPFSEVVKMFISFYMTLNICGACALGMCVCYTTERKIGKESIFILTFPKLYESFTRLGIILILYWILNCSCEEIEKQKVSSIFTQTWA